MQLVTGFVAEINLFVEEPFNLVIVLVPEGAYVLNLPSGQP